jgi:phosphotransferase system enzyme I (PtsI)
MAELRLTGRSASSGFFEGPVIILTDTAATRVSSGNPSVEAEILRKSIEFCRISLISLAESADGEAAEMLGFQVAMLEDDALAEGAFAAISQGIAAHEAWRDALNEEIKSYKDADDEYFRARAADLEDIRDGVMAELTGSSKKVDVPSGSILFSRDLPPSRFLKIDWSKGGALLLTEGSPTSHVAMLARSKNVPMIVNLGQIPAENGAFLLVDGGSGSVIVEPTEASKREFREKREFEAKIDEMAEKAVRNPAVTRDGTSISVMINVADPLELDPLDPVNCDGIGLVRTEFLFTNKRTFPSETPQYHIYRRMLEWANGRPVTIRTLDAGGDKPIPGLTIDGETNPFLGVRGVRLSLVRQDIFRVQLRALARAAVHGPLKVMVPMVTVPSELEQTKALMNEEIAALLAEGIPAALPQMGIMVEVPAAAIAIDLFDADFFSIGSNDLTQYVTAAGRDIGAVADLADTLNPAVLRLIGSVAAYGRTSGRDVGLCGDAGGDPRIIPALLKHGIRSVSVAPKLLARAKQAISEVDLGQMDEAMP